MESYLGSSRTDTRVKGKICPFSFYSVNTLLWTWQEYQWHVNTDINYTKYQNRHMVGKISTVILLQVNFHISLHLTFDLLTWPLTPEYHGGQYWSPTNPVWLLTGIWLESYDPNRVLQVNFHIWPLTSEYQGSQYRASTNPVWLQTGIWLEVINPNRVLQVNFHIWPTYVTFDLIAWRFSKSNYQPSLALNRHVAAKLFKLL